MKGGELIGIVMAFGWSAYAFYIAESARKKGITKRRKLLGNQYRPSGYVDLTKEDNPKSFYFMMGLYYVLGVGGILACLLLVFKGLSGR